MCFADLRLAGAPPDRVIESPGMFTGIDLELLHCQHDKSRYSVDDFLEII